MTKPSIVIDPSVITQDTVFHTCESMVMHSNLYKRRGLPMCVVICCIIYPLPIKYKYVCVVSYYTNYLHRDCIQLERSDCIY